MYKLCRPTISPTARQWIGLLLTNNIESDYQTSPTFYTNLCNIVLLNKFFQLVLFGSQHLKSDGIHCHQSNILPFIAIHKSRELTAT